MEDKNPAIADLRLKKISFEIRRYDVDVEGAVYPPTLCADSEKDSVVKTLVLASESDPLCAIIPYSCLLHMGALSKVAKMKRLKLYPNAEINALTGYYVGAISPFGMRTPLQTFIDEALLEHDFIFVNGGEKGLQLCLPLKACIAAYGWMTAPIAKTV